MSNKQHSVSFLYQISMLILGAILIIVTVGAQNVVISLENRTAVTGKSIEIPVHIISPSNIGGLDLAIRYNTSVLRFKECSTGNLSLTGYVEFNETKPGIVFISWVDTKGVTGEGSILTLTFDVIGMESVTTNVMMVSRGAYDLNLADVSVFTEGAVITISKESEKMPLPMVIPIIALGIGGILTIFHIFQQKEEKYEQKK